MKKNLRWILLITSLCISASFVIISLLYQQSTKPKLAIGKQAIDDQGKTFEGLRNSRRDVSRSSIGHERVQGTPADDDAFESLAQDVLEKRSSVTLQEARDNNAASQISKENDEFVKWYQEMYQEEVEIYTARIKESIARIDPLFEEIEFYKTQVEPLKLQKDWEAYSKTRAKWRSLEREAVSIYVLLRDEELKKELGHLYLSTPQFARVKAFAEHWYAANPRNYNIPRR